MVPVIRTHPRRLPFFRRRHLQEGRRAFGRRTDAAGRRPHAAPPREHAAPRRAHQPPRPRFEGRPARGARGLRRHADLRLARPLLRRQAGDQDRRSRPRRRSKSIQAPTPSSSGAKHSAPPGRRPGPPPPRRPGRPAARRPTAPRPEACPSARTLRRPMLTAPTNRHHTKPRSAPTRPRAIDIGRIRNARAAWPTSRLASPSASRRSSRSKPRWPRPVSTTSARRLTRRSAAPSAPHVGSRRPDESVGSRSPRKPTRPMSDRITDL